MDKYNKDQNFVLVFLKAFNELHKGKAPSQQQWDGIIEILNGTPTEKLA